MKNFIGMLLEIALNLQMGLGSENILTIIIHQFLSSISYFSLYRSFISLDKYISRYFIFEGAVVDCFY